MSTYSGACAANAGRVGSNRFKVPNYHTVKNCNLMVDVLFNHGPINVGMFTDANWFGYTGGIIPSCNRQPTGHSVLLVGFQQSTNPSNANQNYWRFKNSWGIHWGEKGYFRAYRNQLDSANGYCSMCNFGSSFTAP